MHLQQVRAALHRKVAGARQLKMPCHRAKNDQTNKSHAQCDTAEIHGRMGRKECTLDAGKSFNTGCMRECTAVLCACMLLQRGQNMTYFRTGAISSNGSLSPACASTPLKGSHTPDNDGVWSQTVVTFISFVTSSSFSSRLQTVWTALLWVCTSHTHQDRVLCQSLWLCA